MTSHAQPMKLSILAAVIFTFEPSSLGIISLLLFNPAKSILPVVPLYLTNVTDLAGVPL